MKKLALFAAAALTAGSFGVGAVMAQGTDDAFAKADANKDGKLDTGEFTALVGLSAGLDSGTSSSSAQ
jgi:hypothetical protein